MVTFVRTKATERPWMMLGLKFSEFLLMALTVQFAISRLCVHTNVFNLVCLAVPTYHLRLYSGVLTGFHGRAPPDACLFPHAL